MSLTIGKPDPGAEEERLRVEQLRLLDAADRLAEREKFSNCDHIYEDVTEERRSIISKQTLPGWVKHLIAAKDYKWSRRSEAWKTSIYEKCSECGLLKISNEEKNG
jgi:hypothetical protein